MTPLLNSEVTPELSAKAVELLGLHRDEALGSTYPFTLNGIDYIALLSTHPPNATNAQPHPGISLFFAGDETLDVTPGAPLRTILNVPKLEANTSPAFRSALVQLGDSLRINPDFFAAIMSLESGFSPSIQNKDTQATGLIQFMPSTAKALGTTIETLKGMSAIEQLEYVRKYFQARAGTLRTIGDAYLAVFMPAYIGRPDSTEIFKSGSKGYEQNKGLDGDKDGVITVGDVVSAIKNVTAQAKGVRLTVPLVDRLSTGGASLAWLAIAGGAGLIFWNTLRIKRGKTAR